MKRLRIILLVLSLFGAMGVQGPSLNAMKVPDIMREAFDRATNAYEGSQIQQMCNALGGHSKTLIAAAYVSMILLHHGIVEPTHARYMFNWFLPWTWEHSASMWGGLI